jgi:DNA repair protein SbcC/Rad50
MKILALHFKNIHSLKGEHSLDFTIPPLSVSGLFAITGPTGAGKSTVLDVITLALFSRIPRFDSKITNTEIEKIGSVMTQFTDDSYAEVEYQSNGKIYRSTWKISKTRTGNLKPYEMSIATLPDGIYMDLKNSDVPAANERIIGLNYEQFIRSILLSQGEFARFLRSDEKERAKLLEDITGSQIYRALGKAAFEKARMKKDEIQAIKLQISAVPVLTDTEVKDKKEAIISNKNKLIIVKEVLDKRVQLLQLKENRKQILDRLEQLKIERNALENKKEAFLLQEQKLNKHQALEVFRSDITLHISEEKRLNEYNIELSAIHEKIKRHEVSLKVALDKMSAFVRKELHDANFMQEIRKFEQHITGLDTTLQNLKETGAKWRLRLTSILNNTKNGYSDAIKNTKNLADQLTFTEKEHESLKQNTAKYSEVDIKGNIDKLQEQLVVLQQKQNAATARETALLEVIRFGSDIENHSNLKKENTQISERLSKEVEILELDIEKLTKKKEAQLQFTSLEEHRKNLKEGEPCALCGSTHHPFAHEKNLVQIGQVELEIFNKTEEYKSKKNQQNRALNSISIAESKIEILSEQVKTKKTAISEIENKWQLDDNMKFDSIEISKEIENTKSNLTSYIEARESVSSLNFLGDVKEILQELSTIATQYLDVNKERNLLYHGTQINVDAEQILNTYIHERDTGKELKFSASNLTINIQSLEVSLAERSKIILPKLSSMGYGNISEASVDIIEESQLNILLSKKETLKQQEIENKTSINNLNIELTAMIIPDDSDIPMEELKEKIDVLNKEKENFIHQNGAIENEISTDEENKKSILTSQKNLQAREIDASKWFVLDRLIGDSTGNKYAKYAQNLSLRHLITLANKRLSKLSDRYLLAYADIESDLTVTDLYQGNMTRSVKTLSGGESFIVSLALALSLADMASRNVKLESLFIDEGFGTLDAETLETALETLEKLQSESSRTIGVISHVDSLKERITTQVRIHKNNLGHSVIEVV